MKKFSFCLLLFVTVFSFAQRIDSNLQKGFVAEGYDLVAYFSNKALKGSSKFVIKFNGDSFKFSSAKNANMFKENSQK